MMMLVLNYKYGCISNLSSDPVDISGDIPGAGDCFADPIHQNIVAY